LKIMTSRTLTAAAPLWTSLETALRQTWASFSTPSIQEPGLEEIESVQARIRRDSRHWLVG
jgi:hypothetical protein